MKERGILFRDRLVLRINADAKTHTRRIVKLLEHTVGVEVEPGPYVRALSKDCGRFPRMSCPYGYPGDRLWVREAWRTWERPTDSVDGIIFRADNAFRAIENTSAAADRWVQAHDNGRHGEKWRPSIFMPRWASRTTLDIVTIRVERLQDISEADARAEGVEVGVPIDTIVNGELSKVAYFDARTAFAHLWCSVNGADAWKTNPWVWVIEFTRAAQIARAA